MHAPQQDQPAGGYSFHPHTTAGPSSWLPQLSLAHHNIAEPGSGRTHVAQHKRQDDADSWRALMLHARERQSNYGQERMKAARKHRELLLRHEGKTRDANKALELATDLLQVRGAQRRWHARSAALFLPWAAKETRDEDVSYDPLQTAIRTCLQTTQRWHRPSEEPWTRS